MTRLGSLGGALKDIYAFQNGTWLTDLQNVQTQFPANYLALQGFSAALDQVSGLNGPLVTDLSGQLAVIQATAQAIIQQTVQEDNPPSFNVDLTAAVLYTLDQMRQQGQTFKQSTVTATSSTVSGVVNNGNGLVLLTTKRADGLIEENLYAESTFLTCTSDAQQGGTATPGNESFSWVGTQAAVNGFLDPNWPAGSGASQGVQVLSALYNNANGNVLQNGNFESWTVNTPDNWSILAGASKILKSTGQFYTGTACLHIVGDSATNVAFAQQFNSSAGTSFPLPIQTQFGLGFWVFMNNVPAAGIMEAALVDQNGNITTDSYGTQNVCTYNLPAIAAGEPLSLSPSSVPFPSSDWTGLGCFFRTPAVQPTTYFLRFRMTTPLSTGTQLFIDQVAMGVATQLYVGGPQMAIFDGSVHFLAGGPFPLAQGPPDQFKLVATNNRGAASNLATWQTLMLRLATQNALVLWPSTTGVATISDALIA
jgi:hypothetical protein